MAGDRDQIDIYNFTVIPEPSTYGPRSLGLLPPPGLMASPSGCAAPLPPKKIFITRLVLNPSNPLLRALPRRGDFFHGSAGILPAGRRLRSDGVTPPSTPRA